MPPKTHGHINGTASTFIAKLSESNLHHPNTIKVLRFKPTSAKDCPPGLPYAAAGFIIPYFDLHGKPTKFWRYRYLDHPPQKGFDALVERKWLRYGQLPKTVNEAYLPPMVPWTKVAKAPTQPIIITEGELKAACACAHSDYPTIGLGGVWCFKASAHHLPLLPIFKQFEWKGREVYIAYDSDATTNPDVTKAENALARELSALGAVPKICRIPAGPHGAKCGLDDYIVAKRSMERLIKDSSPWRQAQELHQLNEEVTYVRDPGLILRLDTMQRLAPHAFTQHAYSTRIYYRESMTDKGKVKLEECSAAKEWLRWPQRSEVGSLIYEPGAERVVGGKLNIWPGWATEPRKGSVKMWTELLDFIFMGDKEARTWFERWCAYPLQHPGVKMFTSPVLWSLEHGTGKSLIGYSLFRIYGKNATEIKDHNLHEQHNEWAENKQFVMGDEITGGDKRSTSDRLKSLITQEQLRIDVKYIPSYVVRDCINYYFTSNHPDSFFLEDNDRRHFIWEVKRPPLPFEFYKRYETWLKGSDDGPAALFHHLLSLPMGDFDPHAPAPMTAAKVDMRETGRSDIGRWVAMLKQDPDTVLRMGDVTVPYALMRSEDLLAIYDPTDRGRVTINGMGRELRRQGFQKAANGYGVMTKKDGQIVLWVVRPKNVHPKVLNSNSAASEWYEAERDMKKPAKAKEKWK